MLDSYKISNLAVKPSGQTVRIRCSIVMNERFSDILSLTHCIHKDDRELKPNPSYQLYKATNEWIYLVMIVPSSISIVNYNRVNTMIMLQKMDSMYTASALW